MQTDADSLLIAYQPLDRRIRFRVGMSIGDVIADGTARSGRWMKKFTTV